MLKISKSGCRWIYTSTSSVQELLTELINIIILFIYYPREGPWYNVVELGDDEPSYVECSLTADQTEVKFESIHRILRS